MQRKDVERLITVLGNIRLEGVEEDCWAASDALRELLDRAERAEAMLAAKSKVNHELIRGQAEILAANHRLKAERDAAFAAGQEEMRERAASTAVAISDRIADANAGKPSLVAAGMIDSADECAEAIRALPINPRDHQSL